MIVRDGANKHKVLGDTKLGRDCFDKSRSEASMQRDHIKIDRYCRKGLVNQLGVCDQLRPDCGPISDHWPVAKYCAYGISSTRSYAWTKATRLVFSL
jgi:hypothetical protein